MFAERFGFEVSYDGSVCWWVPDPLRRRRPEYGVRLALE
jgi:hypothetical protein